MQTVSSVDELFSILERGGGEAYFGEPVSVLEHSLQTAWFVQRQQLEPNASNSLSPTSPAPPSLVVAALLHDLGHLLHSEGEDAAKRGLDTRHEDLAAELLECHLPASVVDPIRLHVAAKRYLCFAQPGYVDSLSPASAESLRLQAGPMTSAAAELFLVQPHAQAALALRLADDAAKVCGLATPGLRAYRPLVEQLWRKKPVPAA